MTLFPLEVLWYWVIGLSVVMYVVLDGFDLGVGMLHIFTKKDQDRRIFLNAIGPIWDGNELWLVIVVGALFAGFPAAYATLFSSFYNVCMAFLAALIFRAAAIEFRSKRVSKKWRQTWDVLFTVSSFLLAFALGVVMGNLIQGLPLDAKGNFSGNFVYFLRPFPILVGLLSISIFMLHGSLFLLLKTEGALYAHTRNWAKNSAIAFFVLYLVTTIVTMFHVPYMIRRMVQFPVWFILPLAALLAILNVLRLIVKKCDGMAFISSALSILLLFSLYGVGTYPILARSSLNPEAFSVTIFNAASSKLTLRILMIIVVIGIPLILAYGFFVYRLFRGKVKLGPTSY